MNTALQTQCAGRIVLNSARFPMMVVEFHGKASDDQFREYLAGMDQHLERCDKSGRENVLVIDTLQATSPVSAAQRRLQADWMAKNFMRSKARMRGMAFVIDNMLVRGVLTAILWLQTMPCDHAVFGSRAEAEAWALSKLSTPSKAPGTSR